MGIRRGKGSLPLWILKNDYKKCAKTYFNGKFHCIFHVNIRVFPLLDETGTLKGPNFVLG